MTNFFLRSVAACTFAVIITITGFTIFKHFYNEHIEHQIELSVDKTAPYDYFEMSRNYPDFYLNEKAFAQAVAQDRIMQSRSFKFNLFSGSWQVEGPTNIGGRINQIAVHPSNKNIQFIATVYGGIYKTINGGVNWKPVFDSTAYLSIGCITFDPTNPTIMYAGTGDPSMASSSFTGNGIYKSTDGGETWQWKGLAQNGVITKIAIDAGNTQILYAATMGYLMRRDQNRGLYKSTDGGNNWTKILDLGNESGVMDVLIDPVFSNIIYATGMRRIRTNSESIVTGKQTRIYKSLNSGATWDTLAVGSMPNEELCKINIELLPSNPQVMFASVVDSTLDLRGVYKSVNRGVTWTALPRTGIGVNPLGNFGWYFGEIRVNPFNEQQLFIQGVDLWRSDDGGSTWKLGAPVWSSYEVHADKHSMWFGSSNEYLLATDGGLYKTTDNGLNWQYTSNIPITQFYRVTPGYWNAGIYYGGAQDNGTSSGNNNAPGSWIREFGGDGFKTWFSDSDPDLVYYEVQNGKIYYRKSGIYTVADDGIDTTDRKNWDTPYLLSKHDESVYVGTNYVYKATNESLPVFSRISPDLTDGNIFGARFHNISTLAQSDLSMNTLYAGTSDGNVWCTQNMGNTWKRISDSLPDRYVTCVMPSKVFANTVFVSHSGYRSDDYLPHLQRSDDNGNTWKDISNNLPSFAINDILVFSHDSNLILVATDGGVYGTKNGGASWNRVGMNMPVFPVYDLEFDSTTKKVIAGTFARSMMSYDISQLFLSTSEKELANNLSMYPNPAANQLYFTQPFLHAQVYDLKGNKYPVIYDTDKHSLDISHLPDGIWLVSLELANHRTSVVKFIKSNN